MFIHIYTLHYFTLHCIPVHCTALHCSALHYITLHTDIQTYRHTDIHTYSTLHCIALHYITLHYNALHCITLHYITLQYSTLHTYVYIYIYDYYVIYIYVHIYIHMWYMYIYTCDICIWSGWWLSHRSPEIVPNGTLRSFGGTSHSLQWWQNQNLNSKLLVKNIGLGLSMIFYDYLGFTSPNPTARTCPVMSCSGRVAHRNIKHHCL